MQIETQRYEEKRIVDFHIENREVKLFFLTCLLNLFLEDCIGK